MPKEESIDKKFSNYRAKVGDAQEWFESHFENVKALFENITLRDFVFEPFKEVFKIKEESVDGDIYSVITQVAIINAVLAGLPGQMGIGVVVSMALEAWMAYAIAKHVGIRFEKPSDVFDNFGIIASVGITVVFVFKGLLSFVFSIVSVVLPFINPLIIAELLVTNFIGVLFWVGFEQMHKTKQFSIPKRMLKTIGERTKTLFNYQFDVLKRTLSPENIKLVGNRLKSWASGDFLKEQKMLNGEVFATAAMGYLIAGEYEKLQGPLGEVFLQAIKMRWSDQLGDNATMEEIAQRFSEYSSEALAGAINTIKGKMFEIMVTNAENSDNDAWRAEMFEDESHPGSDIVFTNPQTGETVEVSLKATGAHTDVIEHAIEKYPDIPILTTEEAARLYGDNPLVLDSGIENEALREITEEKMDELLEKIGSVDATHVVIGGVTVGLMAALWPFTVAYMRGDISYESFEKAITRILGENSVKFASRLAYTALLGPIFAWYLLARGVDALVVGAVENANSVHRVQVIY